MQITNKTPSLLISGICMKTMYNSTTTVHGSVCLGTGSTETQTGV